MNSNTIQSPRDWAALIFRPVVISAMVSCIVAGWVLWGASMLGIRGKEYLIGLTALATLETLLVERQLQLRRSLDHEFETTRIRIWELVVLIILLKPASYFDRGVSEFLADAQQWIRDPSTFLSLDYVLGIAIVVSAWAIALDIAGRLNDLEDPLNRYDEQVMAQDSLKSQFVFGAILLLVAVGAERLAVSPNGIGLRPTQVSSLTILPLVYVGLGLLVFGQARYALLQATWVREKIPIAPELSKRWAGWGLGFTGGIVLLALLMPAGDTLLGFYLLAWLAYLFTWIGQILLFVLVFLLSSVLAPCLLFTGASQLDLPRPALPELVPQPSSMAAQNDWLLYLRLTVFWVVFALIAFIALRTFWRNRRASGVWKTLLELLRDWWRAFKSRWRDLRNVLPAFPGRRRTMPLGDMLGLDAGWWQNWRAHTPRERVRRLYLALVQRANQAGVPRQADQTPYEYSAKLGSQLPDEQDALAKITDAFVQARYSRRDFQTEEVSHLHRLWLRLQSALRRW